MRKPIRYVCLITALIFVTIISVSLPLIAPSKDSSTNSDYFNFNAQGAINLSSVESHIRNLTSWSRFTTYMGCEAASAYIYDCFSQYGLTDLHYKPYNLTVPVDYGANLTILSPTVGNITAFPLLPNEAQTSPTPPQGVEGSLIYAGNGELSDFNGLDVAGNIVLMEFNSGRNWMNAMKLGAKAVVFLMPNSTDTPQTELKIVDIPIYMPKVLVSRENGTYLKSLIHTYGDVRVRLCSSMTYEEKTARNVVGFIEGSDQSLENEIVVLAAHFDSMSVAPSLAPGAQDASSVASLLELANYFSNNKPRRTLMFVALSGHYQSLAGARSFTEKYFFDNLVYENIGKRIKLFVNLDMATDGQYVGIYYSGFFYYLAAPWIAGYAPVDRFRNLYGTFNEIIENMLTNGVMNQSYLETEKVLIRDECSTPAGWERTQPGRFWLDSEPIAEAGITAVSFRTAYSARTYLKTPFDTFDSLTIDNLKPQLDFTFNVLGALVNRDKIAEVLNNILNRSGGQNRASFGKLVGQIMIWNSSKGWYSNVAEAGIPPLIVYLKNPGWPLLDHNFVAKTDERGRFSLYGLVTPASGVSSTYHLEAYVVNCSGSILYATDFGKYGAAAYSRSFSLGEQLGSEENPRWFIVFQCGSMAVYDCLTPNILTPELALIQATERIRGVGFSYDVLKVSDRSSPDSYGYVSTGLGEALLFVPDTQIMFVMKTGGAYPTAFLTNASSQNPEGVGYRVKLGGFLNLNGTALRYANDMYWYNEVRIKKLHEYTIYSAQAEEFHNITSNTMRDALEALRAKRYDDFETKSLTAFSLEQSAYSTVRNMIMDIIKTIVFFFVTLIPFSMLVERLIFKCDSGLRRAAVIAGTFSLLTLILFFLHPGFRLASNVFMVLLGFVIVVLTAPVLMLVISDAAGYISRFRVKVVGKHYAEISRIGAALMALSTGIENMRRRRLRTTLTFVSVVIITVALVSFTSTSAFTIVRIPSLERKTIYNGILIERFTGMGNLPLSEELIDYVTNEYGGEAYISSRVWIFPYQIHGSETSSLFLYDTDLKYKAEVSAVLGMMPEEANVSDIANRILDSGRWFNHTDYQSCIINQLTSQTLYVGLGDEVIARGLRLKVVGIFDEQKLKLFTELDGELITPVLVQRQHITPSLVMIVPFQLAGWEGEMGRSFISAATGIFQIAMRFEDSDKILDAAKKLAYQFTGLDIFAGRDGTVYELKRGGAFMIRGWTMLIIPAATAFFTIFNTMLGGVYERKGEVSTYSALGLSPLHVALMFLSESLTYAVLAAVVGYTLGIVVVSLLVVFQAIPPGFYPNYSAAYVLLTIGFSMIAVIASTMYPARQAARLVTPSLKRKWELTTKPKGDEWTIPMPFTATEAETEAVLIFVREYLEAHRVERAGIFAAGDVGYREWETKERRIKGLTTVVSLAPWEAAIQQEVSLNAVSPPKEEKWAFELYLKRLAGHPKIWETANRKFVDLIRKQLLLWRGLSPSEKKSYVERTSELGNR